MKICVNYQIQRSHDDGIKLGFLVMNTNIDKRNYTVKLASAQIPVVKIFF